MTESGTPLARKLGIRPGARVALLGAPDHLPDLLAPIPDGVRLLTRLGSSGADVIVIFGRGHTDLRRRFTTALRALPADGGLWLAYPKASSGVATYLTFASVQAIGLDAGLVDNKSCAIDATWTALRFVVPLVRRPTWSPSHRLTVHDWPPDDGRRGAAKGRLDDR